MEETNPLKEYFFNYADKSKQKFQSLLAQGRMNEIITDILEQCYHKASLMNDRDESLGVLATGILHYMLTNTMISSQRKVVHDGIEVDIVIPDIKTLEKDPKKTLVICIPKTHDKQIISRKIRQLQKIQPERENIWLVLSTDLGFENKTFVIQKDSNFSNIVFEIGKFVNVQGQSKLKILRV